MTPNVKRSIGWHLGYWAWVPLFVLVTNYSEPAGLFVLTLLVPAYVSIYLTLVK